MSNRSSPTDSIISNVFGTLGAVCWSIQLTPQIILNYRRHSAAGLSRAFMLLWACAGVPLGVYNIVSDFNIALQIQPEILTFLSLLTWSQCYYYERKWSIRKVFAVVIIVAAILGGIETALIFAVRIGVQRGYEWTSTIMAALAALFLALGVLEQYIAIWKNRSVEGISFLFCGIDAMGDVTSIVSVCFESEVKVLGLVLYAVELGLWIGVFACGAYFKFFPWVRSKLSQRKGTNEAVDRTIEATAHVISLHDLPSSTSVFRMASGALEGRLRTRQTSGESI